MSTEVVIVSAARTPIGSLGGSLATVPAPQLGAACIQAALDRAGAQPEDLDEVIMGNVVSAGVGQNPARQAAIHAKVPPRIGATTVNKVCGSGMKSVMLAAQAIRAGDAECVMAGGMESMSLAPYLLPRARQGYRLGHGQLVDAVIHDGLWDAYGDQHMGVYGDQCAVHCGFSRECQDDFAVRSYQRARQATEDGIFADEIVPIDVPGKRSVQRITEDEEPQRFDESKLRALRPAFASDGTVTAGNASSLNDGAAALLVSSRAMCERRGWKPLARVVGYSTHSREPEWFTLAPVGALQALLAQLNWTVETTDLFEVNEAFSAVALAAARELNIPDDKLNIHGGAVALGHPIGASGARILVTLLNALRRTGGKRGIASLCIGGGEAVALAVELVS